MVGRRMALGIATTSLALLALSCGGSGGYTASSPIEPTPTLEGLVGAYLQAEQAQAEAQRVGAQATLQAANNQATIAAAQANAVEAAALVAAQTEATARAIDARATVQYLDAQATAAAWGLQATQTVESSNAVATTEARSATATAVASNATATVRAEEASATTQAQVAAQTATAQAHQAELEAAELERERMRLARERVTQPLQTWGPWVLLVTGVAGIGWLAYRLAKVLELRGRAVQRDPRGDAPVLLLDAQGGGVVVYDPDRSWGPATVINGDVVDAPQLARPEYQERTTARDQAVDLKTRGLPGQRRKGSRSVPSAVLRPGVTSEPGAVVRVIRPEQVRPWLDEVEGQLALSAGGDDE